MDALNRCIRKFEQIMENDNFFPYCGALGRESQV